MSLKQLPLDLGHRPALNRDDLYVTAGNEEAVFWIDRWPDWSGHALGLYGPEGCGKTHLVHAFASRSNAYVVGEKELASKDPVAIANSHNVVALDRISGPIHEQNLFHLFNAVREAQGFLLIASREPPARWSIKLPDLESRLKGMAAVQILSPDDATLLAVLAKLFRDRQLLIAPDVIEYAVSRMPRTFAATRALVELIDKEALAQNRRVTVPLVRDVLAMPEFQAASG